MRQHPSGPEHAFEALVVDEAVDRFQNWLQLFRQIEIVPLAAVIGSTSKITENIVFILSKSGQEGTGAISSPPRNLVLSRQSAMRMLAMHALMISLKGPSGVMTPAGLVCR
jgi:hypothetical protein